MKNRESYVTMAVVMGLSVTAGILGPVQAAGKYAERDHKQEAINLYGGSRMSNQKVPVSAMLERMNSYENGPTGAFKER